MAKVGIIHYNAPGKTLEEFADFAQQAGYKYVELSIGDVWAEGKESDLEAERRAHEVRALLEKRGLQVSALAAYNDFVVLDEDAVRYQVERMKKVCRLARLLGTDVIRTEGGQPKERVPEEQWAEAIAGCLSKLKSFVETEGFYLAVDNHGLVTNSVDIQLQVFEAVKSPNIGANLDTMNYRWFGYDLSELHSVYQRSLPRPPYPPEGRLWYQESMGHRFGRGEIDLVFAMKCLKDVGYDGVWCVEYEGSDPKGGYEFSLLGY